ncbi:phage tail protein [Staphylococcus haemolyticus]|uniref:phage tail protein n=1 Tax=Staphylococcus haemolyticus TaxID=1283 RepID=UPI001F54520C|nr:phage tail protein [Staphylococcus haemolyticus]
MANLGTSMYLRDLNGDEYMMEGEVKHSQEINGDERIDVEIEYTDVNAHFLRKNSDLKMWILGFETKEYRIISSTIKGHGDRYTVSVTGILYMLDWLNSNRIYQRIDASLTTVEAMNLIFDDSPFTYQITAQAPSKRFEGLGDGETRLEMLKKFIEGYGFEITISGNVMYFHALIGNDTNFQYEYKVNATDITQETDASEMFTYAEGYGDYPDDDESAVSKAKLKRSYVSPLESIVGHRRHAPPIKDGRITNKETMDAALKKLVDDSLQISFSANLNDLKHRGYKYEHAKLGDRTFLVDRRSGLDTEIRVVKIDRSYSQEYELKDISITFGSKNMADTYTSNFSNAVSNINDVMAGRKAIPFEALGIVAQSMVSKIQNTSSELTFDINGIHAIDKNDANNIVTLNSSGMYLSTDGGRTGKTAITAEGIVADTITTGTLNANLISVRGGDNSKFVEIKNDEMTLFGTFKRTWQNNTATNNVFTRFKNGHLRFRNNDLDRSIYLSDFGISTYLDGDSSDASGTLEFFDYTYSGARGVTLNSGLGVVALRTDSNRILLDSHATVNIESKKSSVYIRPMKENKNGNNEFRFWVKDNLQADDTDGVLSYGSITTGSEFGSGIRFDKNKGTSFVYATNNNGDIGSGDFYARDLYGMLKAKADNQYIGVNGALRITDMKGYNGGNVNYKDLQVKDIQAGSIRTHDGNFYIGVSTNELRVTNNLLYNGGDIGYKPVRASDFNNASLEEYKENINEWNFDALSAINNETQLYSFNYKSDEKKETKYGLVIGEGYKTPSELTSGDGVNIYGMATWAFRAIQQLTKRVEELENGTTN